MLRIRSIRVRGPMLAALLVALGLAVAVMISDAPDAQARSPVHSQSRVIPLWTHHVEIKVPFRDENGDGRNDYNPQFNLQSMRTAGPGPDVVTDFCPGSSGTSPTLTVTPRVGNSGSELLATYTASLLHQECELQTTFPTAIASGVPGVELRISAGVTTQDTNRHSDTARVTYIDNRVSFRPNVSVSGFTDEDEGTVITLNFRRAAGTTGNEACTLHDSDRTSSWRIDSRGRAVQEKRAQLIDVPAPKTASDAGLRCSYEAEWPTITGYHSPSPSTVTVTSAAPSPSGVYQTMASDQATPLTPEIDFVVPFTDYDEDGAHDYRGARLAVEFVPTGTNAQRCSGAPTGMTVEYQLRSGMSESGSSIVTPVEPFTLIDSPALSRRHCQYQVNLPDEELLTQQGASSRIRRVSGDVEVPLIDADNLALQVTYVNAAITRAVTFAIDAPAAASGERFEVTVSPSTMAYEQAGCTAERVITLMAGTNGNASEEFTLIDYLPEHGSPEHRCEYTAEWADDEHGSGMAFGLTDAASQVVSSDFFDTSGSLRIVVHYGQQAHVTSGISLQIATSNAATKDIEFDVSFTRSDPACTQVPNDTIVVRAGSSRATLQLEDIIVRPRDTNIVCSYTVIVPQQLFGPRGWELDPAPETLPPTVTFETSGNSNQFPSQSVRYILVFDALVEVSTSLPTTQDTTFDVPLAHIFGSRSECSRAKNLQFTIPQGDTSVSLTLERLLAGRDSFPCVYELQWPEAETSSAATPLWTSDQGQTGSEQVTVYNRIRKHRYHSSRYEVFEARVVVRVPAIEGLTPGVNLFAGAQFDLNFARSPQSHPECSAGTPSSFTYTVQEDGSVTGDHPRYLIDVVRLTQGQDAEPCVYLVSTTTARSRDDDLLQWALNVESITERVDSSSATAIVEYRVADIAFTPDVSIAIPQLIDESGQRPTHILARTELSNGDVGPLTFDVEFTRPSGQPGGCHRVVDGNRTFTVASDGSVIGDGPLLTAYALIDVELTEEGRVTQRAKPCSFSVTFPQASSGQAWLEKTSDASDINTVSAAQPVARATYTTTDILTTVDVALEHPAFASSESRMVSVTVTATSASDAACLVHGGAGAPSQSKTIPVSLDQAGDTVMMDQLSLTSVLEGSVNLDNACAYDIQWSPTDLPSASAIWTLTRGTPLWRYEGSNSRLTATYEVPTLSTFDASVEFLATEHVAQTAAFTVEVRPTAGSPTGCSNAANIFRVTDPSTEVIQRLTWSVQLNHTVAGVVGSCTYDVIWPPNEDGAGQSLYTPEAGYAVGTMLSIDSPSASNRYTNSQEAVEVDAEIVAHTTERVSTATTFVASIAPPTDPANCTVARNVEIVVAQGARRASTTLTVLRRPAMATTDCVYTITWQPNEAGSDAAWREDTTYQPLGRELSETNSWSASNRYERNVSRFTPTVVFDIPLLDFNNDGQHDYTGAHFAVEFVATASNQEPISCSARTRIAYEVRSNGTVEAVAPYSLIDEHGTRRCEYDVIAPTRSTDTEPPLIQVDADYAGRVSSSDAGTTIEYREVVTRFDADLYLGGVHRIDSANEDPVDPIPADTPFTVEVGPSLTQPAGVPIPGCDANPGDPAETTISVVIRKSDALERLPSTRLTRHHLVGLVDETADGETCAYDVMWPDSEDTGNFFRPSMDGRHPFDTELRAGDSDDQGAIAYYELDPLGEARTTFFDAQLTVNVMAVSDVERTFNARVIEPRSPSGCSTSHPVPVTLAPMQRTATTVVDRLILRPFAAQMECVYSVAWEQHDDDAHYSLDAQSAGEKELSQSVNTHSASYVINPAQQPDEPVQTGPQTGGTQTGGPQTGNTQTGGPQTGGTQTGGTQTGGTQTGGTPPPASTSRRPSAGSSGGRPRTTGGGSGGNAAAATQTWTTAANRVPVNVTLTVPEASFAPNSFMEVMVNAPSRCGDELVAFDGLPAEVGLVFAVSISSGAELDPLAGAALRMSSHQSRGDDTRGCDVRLTLISAPAGCVFEGASTDDDTRSYITLDGGDGIDAFAADRALVCALE